MKYPSIVNIRDKCTACGACVNICPKGCVELIYDKEGFLMPEVDLKFCIGCGLCEKSCHIFVTDEKKAYDDYTAYAGWSKKDDLRFASSSGGFFSVFAQQILSKGGIVFGAVYNYQLKRLEHCSTDQCDISALRKSKYIESNTLDTFKQVSDSLKEGREVLYCGTPCQISGLKSYLLLKKQDISNLLLIDFVCHGVPSCQLHAQWLVHLEKKELKGQIIHIDFRSKSRGWMPVSLEYVFKNRKKINIPYFYDYSFWLFSDNRALRRSCYDCEMIHYHKSDITIADFWGRKGVIADDNKGISLAIVSSVVGRKFIDKIASNENIMLQELDKKHFEYIYKSKNQEKYSLVKREETYKLIEKIGYVNTLKRLYGNRILKLKIKNLIKKILRWEKR